MTQPLPWEKNTAVPVPPAPESVPLDAYAAPAAPEPELVPLDIYDAPAPAPAPAKPLVDIDSLNPAQREAVLTTEGPLLVLAGAGSGKTRVLTSRIAYMIEQGIKPWNILALTFTNKAAESMRERIAQMLPDNRSRYIRMGTFHSVFSRILRENAEKIGFTDSFTIYEPSDCKNLLKTIVRELNLPDEKYKPNVLSSRISYAKNCLVTPGAYLANSAYAAEDRQMQIPEFGNIYNIYCQRCKHNGAMDFDDLLLQTNVLLRDCPDVLARYQEQFKYILVDEYQDTNYAQYVIIRRLSQTHSKVCVVGDDAQSIYLSLIHISEPTRRS